jgi:amino acid transporter
MTELAAASAKSVSPKKGVLLIPLVGATYLMVSGGPFGLEDLVAQAGYARTVAILVVTPLIWSLPVAMAVGELASTYPEEGGYYAWVRRAMGPFWGVQEAWWSIAASFFDLAIYPTLFTRYLAQLWAPAGTPVIAVVVGVGLIAAATAVNMGGARATSDTSALFAVALLSPFVALTIAAYMGPVESSAGAAPSGGSLVGGLAIAMWNYMGWDNASTIAAEVKDPGRVYPRAMLATVALVTVTYLIPVLAMAHTGLAPTSWTEGSWAIAGKLVSGPRLATAIAVAGMLSSGGMLLALVMSYSRLPLVLAKDGYLPAWLGKTTERTGAPWVALLICGVLYSACLGLGFKRLVQLDVIIYGASLALEFVALVVLRIKEPDRERPFRVPGGMLGAVVVGVFPMVLIVGSMFAGGEDGESAGARWVVGIVTAVAAAGLLLYKTRGWRLAGAAA